MADTRLYIKDASGNLVPIDVRTTPDGDNRQVFLIGDGETAGIVSPATETTLGLILTELGQKFESNGTVQVGNLPADPATQTTLAAVLAAVDGVEPALAPLATEAKAEAVRLLVAKLTTAVAAVSYGTGTANVAPVAPADATGRLVGYAVRETTGTAGAQVRFRSGTTVSGTTLGAGVTLAANESVREWFAPNGINVPTAVFLERVSGSTEVTVYWAAP
jgi:hypothetical protein